MKDPLRHIEHFIKQRLRFLETPAPNDWEVFEKKLQRALFFRRLKVYVSLGAVTVLFLLINQNLILGPAYQRTNVFKNWEAPAFKARPASVNQHLDQPSTSLTDVALANYDPSLSGTSAQNKQPREGDNPQEVKTVGYHSKTRAKARKVSNLLRQGLKHPRQRRLNVTTNFRKATQGIIKEVTVSATHDLKLPPSFLESRSPGYAIKVRQRPKAAPYISPLQAVNPWSYSINVYPNFTFRKFRVNPDKVHLLHNDFVDEMQENENRGFSLNIGFEVSRRIAPTTYVNTGIEYITNTYQANFNFRKFRESNVDPMTGEILNYNLSDRPEQVVFNDDNQFHYLNVPLGISYQPWATKHLRLNLEAGASLLYFLNARGTTLDYSTLDIIDLSERSYRKFMGSLSMKIGMQYWVNPQVNIGFEPTFMYFTNTIYTNDYPFDVIPYSLGLNLNLQIKLN